MSDDLLPTTLFAPEVVLDSRLSPRARLLYAVLVAKLARSDHEGLEAELLQELPVLVGLAGDEHDQVQVLVDELVAYGVLSRLTHAVRDAKPVLRVHLSAPLRDAERACHTCTGCGACACAEVRWIPFTIEAQCKPCKALAAR
ncbi:hypothetical protein [Streptomyces cucumeris]|uniref:hypothetical protein n=1 Tax=Streptomyces cucumeris TaxID=2962890 RepID=UPI003D762EFA